MTGRNPYDKQCTYVRETTNADCAIVIITGGAKGDGVSVQTRTQKKILLIPELLRKIADEIERYNSK